MDKMEVIVDIEKKLTEAKEDEIIKLCEKYFPEEDFGEYTNNGIIDDMYNIILNEASSNNEFAIDIYQFLLNEKITIDEDEFYLDEEINHG